MRYLFSFSLIKNFPKLKFQFFNRKSFSWILFGIIVISIVRNTSNIISWIWNFCPVLSYIIITGQRHYITNNDIYDTIKNLGVLSTCITRDINIIQNQIERLSWVQQVSIRTQWPDTLKIHIVEHIPVAFWNDLKIISTTGRIFSISEKYRDRIDAILIPVLYGPVGSEQEILTYYYIFDEILKKSTKLQIQSLRMDIRCSWTLVLKDNMCINLGRKNIIERLNYFVKIHPILLYKMNKSNKYIDYIDLRYTVGFAVKWIPNTTDSVFCNK